MNFKVIIPLIIAASLILPENIFSSEVKVLKRAKDYRARIPAEVIKEVPLPEGYHEGLFFDGKDLWVCNGEGGNIWIVDPETGKMTSEITPVGTFTEAIASYGDGTYWLTDWDAKKIYRVTIDKGRMLVEYEIALDPSHPTGVVWTGKYLYMITWTRTLTGTEYHLMQLGETEKMFRKMRIKRIHEPAHLAWDGEHLWITSWYSRLVYKVDVENFRILGSFKSPVKDTTGIAWDGNYFWITGTKSDLYKVEI